VIGAPNGDIPGTSWTPRPPVASAAAAPASVNAVGVGDGVVDVATAGDVPAVSCFGPPQAATAATLVTAIATTAPRTTASFNFTPGMTNPINVVMQTYPVGAVKIADGRFKAHRPR
jgi:hypothetical protein